MNKSKTHPRSKRQVERLVSTRIPFEKWKKDAIEYLHAKCTSTVSNDAWDWIMGDDEDMLPSYNDGESPAEYVDYQIECAH